MSENVIRMYATAWCGDCWRAKRYLDGEGIAYEYIDINEHPEGANVVEKHNQGNRSVPTIVFPDGSVLVEPSTRELAAKVATG